MVIDVCVCDVGGLCVCGGGGVRDNVCEPIQIWRETERTHVCAVSTHIHTHTSMSYPMQLLVI
jgi:hypothetical protein